jgi:hypothetical protein
LKPKGEYTAAIADGIALKATTFALVKDPDLEAQAALKTSCLFVDSNKLPRQPHAVEGLLTDSSSDCHGSLEGEVLPEVFPATLLADLVTLTHMLVHCTCILVVAKEWHSLLPVEPVAKLGLWGQTVCKEQAYKLI